MTGLGCVYYDVARSLTSPQFDRRSHFGLGKNPDPHFLIVIPTNGVREEESAGLEKADSSAKKQASE